LVVYWVELVFETSHTPAAATAMPSQAVGVIFSFSTNQAMHAARGGTRKNRAETLVASPLLIIISNRVMAKIELQITK